MSDLAIKTGVIAIGVVGGIILESGINKVNEIIDDKIDEMETIIFEVKKICKGRSKLKVKLNKKKVAALAGKVVLNSVIGGVCLTAVGYGYTDKCDTRPKEAVFGVAVGLAATLMTKGLMECE